MDSALHDTTSRDARIASPESPIGRTGACGYLAALAMALVVYGLTAAPDLVWHDAGDYQWQAANLILERPGDAVRVHPLFLLPAHALGRAGLWSYAQGATAVSVIGTSLLAANVWLIGYLLTRRFVPATIGFLSCLLAHTIWQQGVQPQTYGLSNAFLIGAIVAAVCYAQSQRARWLMAMFFIGGLGLGVHVLSQLGVFVLGVWVLLRVLRRRTPAWVLPAGAALWILGGATYWYVVALEYGRTGDLGATLVSAVIGKWGTAVFNVGGLVGMVLRSLLMCVLNFPTPVVLLGVYGIWRSRRALAGRFPAALLGALLGLYVLFAVRYDVPNQNHFFTPAYALLAVYIAVGAHATGWCRRRWAAVLILLTVAVVPMYAAMAATARAARVDLGGGSQARTIPYRDFYDYYLLPWQHTQTGARRFADEALTSVPQGAVIIADSTTISPLKYARFIEGRRPDVIIAAAGVDQGPDVRLPYWGERNLLGELRAVGRRVFVVSDHPAYVPKWVTRHCRLEPFGLLYEVLPAHAGTQPATQTVPPGRT